MGKLYILIFLTGKLVGTIGPLPYDMNECLERAAEKRAIINSDEMKREVARSRNLDLRCEYRESRPLLDDGTKGIEP